MFKKYIIWKGEVILKRKIAIFRKKKGYTQSDLAAKVNVTRAYLNKVENQKRVGSLDLYCKLAKELGTSVDELLKSV